MGLHVNNSFLKKMGIFAAVSEAFSKHYFAAIGGCLST
jgi:hypothetical protein